jgi:hypothetical protein
MLPFCLEPSHPKCALKEGVVYGTHWDAPDQRTCCHLESSTMYKSKGIQKKKVQYAGNSIILHQNTFVSS